MEIVGRSYSTMGSLAAIAPLCSLLELDVNSPASRRSIAVEGPGLSPFSWVVTRVLAPLVPLHTCPFEPYVLVRSFYHALD